MVKNSNQCFSAAKLALIFQVLEPGYIFRRQWDCSNVVDLILSLYETFLYNQDFDGKKNALKIIDSLKISIIFSTQCNICSGIEEKEVKDFFLFVPLTRNVDNIFVPFLMI